MYSEVVFKMSEERFVFLGTTYSGWHVSGGHI